MGLQRDARLSRDVVVDAMGLIQGISGKDGACPEGVLSSSIFWSVPSEECELRFARRGHSQLAK